MLKMVGLSRDPVALANELRNVGVDVIDCSSGGISGSATAAKGKRMPGYQVPFAEKIKQNANVMTMAVGLITHPEQANQIIENGQADLVAVAREALFNPTGCTSSAIPQSRYAILTLAKTIWLVVRGT